MYEDRGGWDMLSMEELYGHLPPSTSYNDFEEDIPQKDVYVYVYGSLRQGFGNHRLLRNSERIGDEFVTKKRYRMVSLGGYPMVLKALNLDKWDKSPSYFVETRSTYRPITGEVYKVDLTTLNNLDMLEGNGYFYNRELIDLHGFNEKVWIYIGMDRVYHSYRNVALDEQRNFSWPQERMKQINKRKWN